MTITPASLTTGQDGAPAAASKATASITPTSNALVMAHVCWAASNPNTCVIPPTVTGNGLTWELIDHRLANSGGSGRATAIYAAQGAAPSAGAVTFTWGFTTTAIVWEIVEFQGAHVGSTAAAAILQVEGIHSGANVNDLEDSLMTLQDATNWVASFGMSGANSQTLIMHASDTGWTKVAGIASASALFSIACLAREGSGDLTPRFSWTTVSSWTVHTFEIRAAGGASSTFPLRFNLVANGSGSESAATTHITGDVAATDLVTTDTSPVVTSSAWGGTDGPDASWVGLTISGTNIPGGTTVLSHATTDAGTSITMSANATGTGTSANGAIIARPVHFVAGHSYIMAISGRRAGAAQTPNSVALTSGGAWTQVGTTLTYNTERTLSVWLFECTSTVDSTVTIVWPQSATSAYVIYEIEHAAPGVVSANIVTDTGTGVTALPLTMGAYADARSGVLYFVGVASVALTGKPIGGMARRNVRLCYQAGTSCSVTGYASWSNIATPDAVFASTTTGAFAVEILAAESGIFSGTFGSIRGL
jgi:hypothetical protein